MASAVDVRSHLIRGAFILASLIISAQYAEICVQSKLHDDEFINDDEAFHSN